MRASVQPVRIDAAPYRQALTEMGGLIRSSDQARQIWVNLRALNDAGRVVFAVQRREGDALVTRPSPEFVAALERMRAVVK